MEDKETRLPSYGESLASPDRRRIMKMAAAIAALPLASACGSGGSELQAPSDVTLPDALKSASTRTVSFDANWQFFNGTLDPAAASLASFADQGWRSMNLPHDWSIEDLPGGSDDGQATSQPSHLFVFEQPTLTSSAPTRIGPFDKTASPGDRATGRTIGGEGWYRKHFTFKPTPGQQVELRFDGVYQNSDVWINGQHLGFHPYGYTAFAYDLTPYLVAGDNVIAVRVQNLGLNSRWYAGSGIYRHTHLTTTNAVRIPRFGVGLTTQQLSAGSATVNAQITVQNASTASVSTSVRILFFDASGKQVANASSAAQTIAAGASKDTLLTIAVPSPQIWSPDTPYLYTAVVQVNNAGTVTDQTLETFGIRTVTVSATDGFILNGTPLKLKGGNVHHTNGALGSISLGDEEYWRMSTLKAGGFNAVRCSHNPPSREFVQAAEKVGMILLNEFVDMWDVAKNPDDYHLYFPQYWESDLESWVLASRNSPAVCLWSIANEIYDSTTAQPRGQQLITKLKSLDTSRPVMQGGAQGILSIYNGPSVAPYTDFCDVHYEQSYVAARQAVPNKAWNQSESYASTFYDNWQQVTNNSFVVGDFVWTAWDYMGEAGLNVPALIDKGSDTETSFLGPGFSAFGEQAGGAWAPYPWFAAGCGDFDLIGQPTAQHLYRRAVWNASPIEMAVARPVSGNQQQQAFSFGWFDELESWTWDVPAATSMRVHVYTSADRVDLHLNGQLLQSLTLQATDKCIASFWVPYQAGTLQAIAFKNGTQIGSKTLTTTGASAAIQLSSDTLTLAASPDAVAHVLASVVDAQGRLVPDAVVRVSFAASGGQLAAVGSGNPHNVDSFQRGKRYSYHGKAMAYIRAPQNPGQIVVTASADGLSSASLTLTVA
ncbi:beta-galactosidase [Paraburkholderia fungorum]|uniref:Beta-galactosidase n=1 Tax=Paraburkholderia fungorum TaxID=134537 RepID=A0A1H1JNT2_9BURK|nr:sugar-binding domain-containing protein [Paraburkholderia fungorum]SDR51678.1 beta-galactosidase [Paraburkholderia fungorum]